MNRVSAFRAHVPFAERPPRLFLDRGIAVSCVCATSRRNLFASHSGSTVDRGRPGRLLGFGPFGKPYRRRVLAWRPVLPWALVLSQAFGPVPVRRCWCAMPEIIAPTIGLRNPGEAIPIR